MFFVDEQAYEDASSTKANYYFCGLDLFGGDDEDGLRANDVIFFECPNFASDYVRCDFA